MEEMTLKEWVVHFVKNKDLLERKLQDYEEKNNILVFHFSHKEHYYLVAEILDESVLNFVKQPGFKSVVCSSAKENLKFLIENWKNFSTIENLSFVFVMIRDNKRWVINPFVHSKICDDSSLSLGLKSMYSNAFQS